MPSILVIDSDPVQRAALAHALGPLGELVQAASGLDALRLLASRKFALVLIDLHVRPLDGFVILRTLAAKPGPNQETPVYALAADAAEQSRALRERAVFALIKPFAMSTVTTLVEVGLRKPAEVSEEGDASPRPPSAHAAGPGSAPPPAAAPRSPAPPRPAAAPAPSRPVPPPSPSRPGLDPAKPVV